ncbi:MAG: betaine/proline/choline family ABC transporter ATP-binding protein [Lachnospiraceae bacterium]
MIRFDNVNKKYKETEIEVLSEVSFEIPKGNLVVLIGASGCGKTTTLKMINRLTKPTTGKIYIDGEDISTKDVVKLRRKMGYVIQQTGLFPHMTIRENIEIIPRVEKIDETVIQKRTYELMDMVGLSCDEYLDRYPTQLSGGQQQRVGVARAFATEPEIILMDEPFSALDPITRSDMQDELIDIQSRFKKTIVFVTHDMDEAIKIADKICIMDHGKIVQYDIPENILKHPANEFVAQFVGNKRIWSSPQFIKAEDIVVKTAVTATSNTSLSGCLDMMRSRQVDRLIILERKSRVIQGILTAEMIYYESDMRQKAEDIMITDFLSVLPEETLIQILQKVQEHKLSTIPVVNRDGVFSGLITRVSLITTLSKQYSDEGGE